MIKYYKPTMKIRYTLLWCSFLFILTWGCTTIEKFFSKQKESTESTTYTKTEKIETSQKDLQVVGGVQIGFDTGCLNSFSYDANTGQIQASGGVTGVRVNHEKKEAVKEAKSDKGETLTVTKTVTKLVTKQVTKKVIPWWCYALLGVGLLYVVYRISPFKIPFIK